MNNNKGNFQKLKTGILRTSLWTLLTIVIIFFITTLALQHPYIQTKLVKEVASYLSKRLETPIELKYVNFRWFDTIFIKGLKVDDEFQNQMIYVDEVTLNFNLQSMLREKTTEIEAARLVNADINLLKEATAEDFNIDVLVRKIKRVTKSSDSVKKAFNIKKVQLMDSKFRMANHSKDSIFDRWDYNHFVLQNLYADIENLNIHYDTLAMQVHELQAIDSVTKFNIENLSTFFRFTENDMLLKEMKMLAGKSDIQNTMLFSFDDPSQLSYFNDSIDIEADIKKSFIFSGDLAHFAPSLEKYRDYYVLSGEFNGKVNKFDLNNFEFLFGNNSSLSGSLSIDGLPRFLESFIMLNLNDGQIDANDLRPYVRRELYTSIRNFGRTGMSGNFIGFPLDFVSYGTFDTQIGKITSDINLKVNENEALTTYNGSLSTTNFNLGRLLNREDKLQKIDMQGQVNGRGFTIETADFDLNANFSRLGFNGYDYRNIETNAHLAKELFNGKLNIDDPNLKFNADALVDLRENRNKIDIAARLDTARTLPLKFTEEDIFFSTQLDVDVTGLQLDSIWGDMNFSNLFFSLDDRSFFIDSLKIKSTRSDSLRQLSINNDKFNFSASGAYDYTTIIKDWRQLINEYKLNIVNDQELITDYYEKRRQDPQQNYFIDFAADFKDVNPIIQVFYPKFFLSKNTGFKGKMQNDSSSYIWLKTQFDTIKYDQYQFYRTDVLINTEKSRVNENVDSKINIFSEKQGINDNLVTENLGFGFTWNKKHIDFDFNLRQSGTSNLANIAGMMDFFEDSSRLHFKPSLIRILEEDWTIEEDNLITIIDKKFEFHNFEISNNLQGFKINGIANDSTDERLLVDIHNFDINTLSPILKRELSGTFDGIFYVSNLFRSPVIDSNINIDELKIKNFLVGDITGASFWNKQDKKIYLDLNVINTNRKIMDVNGFIEPENPDNQLFVFAKLDDANLNILEPFIDDYFSNIQGTTSGRFEITGKLKNPLIEGTSKLDNGQLLINYLNTTYAIAGDVVFEENNIVIDNVVLEDDEEHLAYLNGGIAHNGFSDFNLNILGSMTNFKVLNTSAKDNSLYYGVANVSGDISFLGSFKNMNIDANAITERGTRFYVPLSETTEIEQVEFIKFIRKGDPIESEDNKDGDLNDITLSGLKMDFDLEVTPDAYCEIIFDLKAGDIIRGRGNGKLKLQIDTKGDFNMFGDFDIREGGYNFTMYNVINKEFDILPESKITWTGDPYHAQLDIQAKYEQYASLAPLFNDTTYQSHPDIRRKYPAKVLLDLEGDLMSPTIDFDIDVVDYPSNILLEGASYSLEALVSAFNSRIQSDEQELKRQVFSLIILRRFSPENSFNVSGSFGNSVSEFISNQLSYWINQMDENLEIDVDLGSMDEEAFNTFQLRLSYTFLEGRLRVTRVGVHNDTQTQDNLASIAGDWTLEYLLTPDGKFRVKMYNRTNFNPINSSLDNSTNTTAGFSVMHTESFDDLMELFKKARDKELEKTSKVDDKKNRQKPDPEYSVVQ